MRLLPLAAAAAFICCSPVEAGTLTCDGGACAEGFAGAAYAPAHCPAAAEVPHLRSGDKASYDKSVAAAKAYSDAAAARMNCIVEEANADATQIQAAIKAGVKRQQDDAQAKIAALQTALNNLPRH